MHFVVPLIDFVLVLLLHAVLLISITLLLLNIWVLLESVLFPETVLFLWLNFVSIVDIFLGRGVVLELVVHTVNWNVEALQLPEDVLDRLEDLLTVFALEHVVILVLDMDDELIVLLDERLGQ